MVGVVEELVPADEDSEEAKRAEFIKRVATRALVWPALVEVGGRGGNEADLDRLIASSVTFALIRSANSSGVYGLALTRHQVSCIMSFERVVRGKRARAMTNESQSDEVPSEPSAPIKPSRVKRGAFPTPKSDIEKAKPYIPVIGDADDGSGIEPDPSTDVKDGKDD